MWHPDRWKNSEDFVLHYTVWGLGGDVAGFIHQWKVKGECILTHYKKVISYLFSYQLDQVCDIKIDLENQSYNLVASLNN